VAVTDPSLLAPSFQYNDATIVGNSPVGTVVVRANPYRVAFVLSGGGSGIIIRPGSALTPAQGIQIPATQGFIQLFKFSDLGGLITMQWVLSASNTSQFYVAESIYYPLES
jgi:hypothetical protein